MIAGQNPIENTEDTIDSRDVIARIAWLEDCCTCNHDTNLCDLTDDEHSEASTLQSLEREACDYTSEWEDGATLIRDSYFEEYAEQMAEDIGAIDSTKTYGWPLNCIDWERAARELQADYSEVDFAGVSYWIRA